jgi:hypothetical protein
MHPPACGEAGERRVAKADGGIDKPMGFPAVVEQLGDDVFRGKELTVGAEE